MNLCIIYFWATASFSRWASVSVGGQTWSLTGCSVMDLPPGPRLAHVALEAAVCQWEPTLAALHLRQSPRTDGAKAGWDPEQNKFPAMNRHWFTLRLGCWWAADLCWLEGQLSGGGGWWWRLWQMCDWKKASLLIPGDWLGFCPPVQLWGPCSICAESMVPKGKKLYQIFHISLYSTADTAHI